MGELLDRSGVDFQAFAGDIDMDLGEPRDIPELIAAYNKLGLGRKIEFAYKDEVGTLKREIGGYMLPSSLDNTEHLTILKTGEMIVTKPQNTDPATIDLYKRFYSPSPLRFQWLNSNQVYETAYADFVTAMSRPLENGKSTIVMTNMQSGGSVDFVKKLEDATAIAFTLREQRLQGMATTRSFMLKNGLTPNFTPFPLPAEEPVPQISPAPATAEITLFDEAEVANKSHQKGIRNWRIPFRK